jgi:ATP-dependent Clp protease adapter protein ClpS
LEHLPCDGDLGHLEHNIAAVAHDFRADLDGMTRPEAQSQMLSIHYEGRAICGTYPYEEAEKKVVLVFCWRA